MRAQIPTTVPNQSTLWMLFGLTSVFSLAEITAALLTNSRTLLAGAAHMLIDVGGLALALFVTWISSKPASKRESGYFRVEVLAALGNATVVFSIACFIVVESVRRFREPPEVVALPMLAVATVGLFVNAAGVWILRRSPSGNRNIRRTTRDIAGDLLGSAGVAVAAGFISITDWKYADPLFGILMSLIVLPRIWKLLVQAVDVLLEANRPQVDLDEVRSCILSFEGVSAVHDLHARKIASGIDAVSARVVWATEFAYLADDLVEQVEAALKEQFPIGYTTIQIEHSGQEAFD